MLTRKRLPPLVLTKDWAVDGPNLLKWITDYFHALEMKEALAITEASINGTPIGASDADTGKFTTIQGAIGGVTPADGTFTKVTIDDANHTIDTAAGGPRYTMDSNDYFEYTRAGNLWSFYIGGTPQWTAAPDLLAFSGSGAYNLSGINNVAAKTFTGVTDSTNGSVSACSFTNPSTGASSQAYITVGQGTRGSNFGADYTGNYGFWGLVGANPTAFINGGKFGVGIVPLAALQVKHAANIDLLVAGDSGALGAFGAISLNAVNDAVGANIPMEIRATKFAFTGPANPVHIDVNNNVGIGHTTFGTNAVGVVSVKNLTAPTTGPADTVQFYSSDDTAGNTVPSFFCEGTGVVATGQADSASSVRVKMRINGTVRTFLCI